MLITSSICFDIAFTNIETTLKQRRDIFLSKFFQLWYNVATTSTYSCINVVSTFFHSDVVSTPTLYRRCVKLKIWQILFHFQRQINVDPQRWNNVDPTLKCWLGVIRKICRKLKEKELISENLVRALKSLMEI